MTSLCEAYFIRHGETDWNLQERIQGHTDIPLNATGISQASNLGQMLANVPFSAAFSSDLSRAQQTAEIILKPRTLPITTAVALRERSAGILEGIHKEHFEEKIRPFLTSEQALDHDTYLRTPWHPELETPHSVFQRVIHFLSPLAARYASQTLLIVSHGGVLRSILDHLLFTPNKRWIIGNCGFIKIRVNQHSLQLINTHRISNKHMS